MPPPKMKPPPYKRGTRKSKSAPTPPNAAQAPVTAAVDTAVWIAQQTKNDTANNTNPPRSQWPSASRQPGARFE